jgi:hypothetical protein
LEDLAGSEEVVKIQTFDVFALATVFMSHPKKAPGFLEYSSSSWFSISSEEGNASIAIDVQRSSTSTSTRTIRKPIKPWARMNCQIEASHWVETLPLEIPLLIVLSILWRLSGISKGDGGY